MMSDLSLRRKLTLRAHGRQVVFVKRPVEHSRHVLMKAFLWALYLPAYPDLAVEIDIGDRYRPDVVALGDDGRPRFWGEAGEVGREKIRALARRHPAAHLAIARWDERLGPLTEVVRAALRDVRRQAPFDLLRIPPDAAERFIAEDGEIALAHEDLPEWVRL
ncbi:MAG TPA: hypothetical protein PKD53_31480 [Chloroflexaceae bacterium]|nr:hypothetical protein [Chloroflexaceae bacterium]